MKHYVTPKCKYECRFLQISDELWLCPHAAYGAASYEKGAVEDGRRLLEKAGGYEAVLTRIERKEEEQRHAARERKQEKQNRLAQSVKYE